MSGRFKARAVAIGETGFKYMGRRAFTWLIAGLESRLVIDVRLTVNRADYDVASIVGRLSLRSWHRAFEWMDASHRHEHAFRPLEAQGQAPQPLQGA